MSPVFRRRFAFTSWRCCLLVLAIFLAVSSANAQTQQGAQSSDTSASPNGTSPSPTPSSDVLSPSPSLSPSPQPSFPASLTVLYAGATSLDTARIDTELTSLIDESAATLLSQSGYTVIKASTTNAHTAPLIEAAKSQKAAALVTLHYFADANRITLIARLYDTWTGRFLTGSVRSGVSDLSLLSLLDLLLADIRDELAAQGPALVANYGAKNSDPLSRSLIISGPDEGAKVSLEGADTLGVIQNGTLKLDYRPLVVDQNVRLLIEKEGFYPRHYDMLVSAQTPEPALPKLYPMGRFSVLLNWDPITFASLGLGARVYPIADTWYVETDYTFVSASARQNIGRAADEVQVPFSFNHRIDLQTGLYLFFPPESLFRFHIGLGAGFAIFPGPPADPEIMRNLIFSLPIAAIDLNLRPFTASISFGSEYAVDIGGRQVYPPGLIRSFQPFRISIGLLL